MPRVPLATASLATACVGLGCCSSPPDCAGANAGPGPSRVSRPGPVDRGQPGQRSRRRRGVRRCRSGRLPVEPGGQFPGPVRSRCRTAGGTGAGGDGHGHHRRGNAGLGAGSSTPAQGRGDFTSCRAGSGHRPAAPSLAARQRRHHGHGSDHRRLQRMAGVATPSGGQRRPGHRRSGLGPGPPAWAGTLDYFALRDDKARFVHGNTVVAYRVRAAWRSCRPTRSDRPMNAGGRGRPSATSPRLEAGRSRSSWRPSRGYRSTTTPACVPSTPAMRPWSTSPASPWKAAGTNTCAKRRPGWHGPVSPCRYNGPTRSPRPRPRSCGPC